MKQVRDRGDDNHRYVALRIEARNQQPDSHRHEKCSTVGDQVRIERAGFRNAGHQAKEPHRRREKHSDAVDE